MRRANRQHGSGTQGVLRPGSRAVKEVTVGGGVRIDDVNPASGAVGGEQGLPLVRAQSAAVFDGQGLAGRRGYVEGEDSSAPDGICQRQLARGDGGEGSAGVPSQRGAGGVLAIRHGPPNRPVRRERRCWRAGQHGVAGAPGEGCGQKLKRGRIEQIGQRHTGIHGLTEGNDHRCRERDTAGAGGGNGRDDGGLSVRSLEGHQRKQQDQNPDQIIATHRES